MEDFAHMILCPHSERRQWRRQFIKAIRATMERQKTKLETIELISHVFTDYFEQGQIDITSYDTQYHHILHSQHQIGWLHLFMGRYTIKWDTLAPTEHWVAALVETTIQQVITLWETRNAELHGHTEADQKARLLTRQRTVIQELLNRKPHCLPSDTFLFPDNPEELLQKTSTTELGNRILTRRPAILYSQRQAKERALAHTKSVSHWFRPL